MKFTQEEVLGIIRHTLTFIGGIAVSKGLIDDSTLTQAVGAIMTLSGLAWSIITKRKKQTN